MRRLFGIRGLLTDRDLYRATPAVVRGLGFCSFVQKNFVTLYGTQSSYNSNPGHHGITQKLSNLSKTLYMYFQKCYMYMGNVSNLCTDLLYSYNFVDFKVRGVPIFSVTLYSVQNFWICNNLLYFRRCIKLSLSWYKGVGSHGTGTILVF